MGRWVKHLHWDGKVVIHVFILLSSSVWTNDVNKLSVTSDMGRSVCVCLEREAGRSVLSLCNDFI